MGKIKPILVPSTYYTLHVGQNIQGTTTQHTSHGCPTINPNLQLFHSSLGLLNSPPRLCESNSTSHKDSIQHSYPTQKGFGSFNHLPFLLVLKHLNLQNYMNIYLGKPYLTCSSQSKVDCIQISKRTMEPLQKSKVLRSDILLQEMYNR